MIIYFIFAIHLILTPAMITFKDILERLTGISCPIFGVSWNPPEPERKVAQRIICFLEDKRVLYNSFSTEFPDDCHFSVLEIRKYLTLEMQKIDRNTNLYGYVSAMRIACRKFVNTAVYHREYNFSAGCEVIKEHKPSGWMFISALGELRGTFGNMVAQIAAAYGLDIEDDLATILPGEANAPGVGIEGYIGFIPDDDPE